MSPADSKSQGRKRRILLVIDSLARGGAQRQAFLLVRGLAARGHTVRVLALNDDSDPSTFDSIASVSEVEVIGKVRLAMEMGPLALWRRFRAWQPDAILTMLEVSDLLGRIAGRLYGGAPVVTSIRARNAQKHAWWLWLDRLTMDWADRVVFNCAAVVSISQKSEGVRSGQVCVIFNGVDTSEAHSDPSSANELGIRAGAPVVLTAGRLQPQKRFEVLLAAMTRLPGALGQSVLLIAGAGPLDRELRAKATKLGLADRVRFLGKREDMPALMALADVFVLPSAWEGMSNVVMEAMAAGRPVVTTRIDGNIELLPDASFGWLVEPDNPDQLAAALAEALGNRADASRRAERARDRAIESFSVDRMVERYEALFDELSREALP